MTTIKVKIVSWILLVSVLMISGCMNQKSIVEDSSITDTGNLTNETKNNDGIEMQNNDLSKNSIQIKNKKEDTNIMKIKVGDNILTATLVDNSSTKALIERLSEGDLSIDMKDYGNMEKVGTIGKSIPSNNKQITTEAGDIILYQGNALVIYYDTNSWNFTRLGKIDNITQEELKDILGQGDVTVTLSLD